MAIKSSDQISIVDLTDGYSVILTNDSFTFPGSTNAAKAGNTTTTIIAMCGANQIPAAVDNSKIIAPTGVTTSVDTDATQPTVTIAVTTSVKAGGTVDIPVSLDNGNIIIHKYFTFQIAFTGATGSAGSSAQWYSGTKITGTSTTATIFSDSGITAAKVGDMYLNTDTMNTYRCTTAGAASAAKWVYVGNIKGATGETGAGAIWYTGTKITGTSTTATIFSGSGITAAKVGDIKQILTNEKYIGDALLQKTYTVNTLEKKRVANNGLAPKYYVEGSHEAIIERDVFLRVQAEIVRRANILTDGKRRIYSSRYALSSLVVCGHCGDIYRRIKWNNRGCKSTVWRCVSRVLKKSSGIDCPARTIHEEDLQTAVVTAINDAWSRRESVLPALKENIRSAIEGDSEAQIAEVDREIKERQAELLGAGNDQKKIDKIGDAIISLREERQAILADAAARQGLRDKVNDLVSFLDEQTSEITEYSETLVRRLIEKITVYDEKLTIEFKSGLEIDVDA